MANQVRIKVAGALLEQVVSVEFGLDVASGMDGHPQDARPRLSGIRIMRKSDKKTDLWSWAIEPWASAFKKGTIEFLDQHEQDKVIKTVNWEDGFITSYTEELPHVQASRDAPVTETIVIAARIVDFDGAKITAYEK